MTREEKQKAIDALRISTPIIAVTHEEFDDYIRTRNKIMDWLEQTPMRDATSEEQKSINDYIKSISKTTGVNFWNLEKESCDDCDVKIYLRNKAKIEVEKAIALLSMIEFDHAECCLNTWYKGIDDDMKEALKMAIKALEQNNNQIISAEGRLFKVEKPVVKSVDCYNLWNIYGFKEITDGTE